ncbi:MAG: glutamine synthetase family protein [Endozoicomonas sp.]
METNREPANWEAFLEQHAEPTRADLLIADINGILRGKRVERSKLESVFESGVYLAGSVFGLSIEGHTAEATGLGVAVGDADKLCYPVPGSLALIPWQEQPSAQLLLSMHEQDGSPFFADPRHRLRAIQKHFDELGLTIVCAVEMEFYLIDRHRDNDKPQPPLSPVSLRRENTTQCYSITDLDNYDKFLSDVISSAREQNLPADSIIAEYAPGQFEVNLHHIDDPLKACDQAVLLKRVIRNVALKHDMEATFMAKPYPDQAGSGTHIHISLLDSSGDNVFVDDSGLTETLEHAVGGLLELMPDSMALLCPNVNSYKRFDPQFYAPCTQTWGLDNRTTAIRIPAGSPENTRIEYRVPGADSNPYLVMATLLAGIHHGLTQKITPPPLIAGDAIKQAPRSLPENLREALSALDQSEILKEYFGEDFISVYMAIRQEELTVFEREITRREYDWLLTMI